jgi:hypothetical protein
MDYEPLKPKEPAWKSIVVIVLGVLAFLAWVMFMAVTN